MRPHPLKNARYRLFEESTSLPIYFCLLLTGTPLQNYTEELWALLKISDSDKFESKEALVQIFWKLTNTKQLSELHTVLKISSMESERGCGEVSSS